VNPAKLWKLSSDFHLRGWEIPARVLKVLNYLLFKTVLPYEVQLGTGVKLWHRGLGVVVHPNVRIGDNVQIAHGVTIQGTGNGTMVIENDVKIGAGALILTRRSQPITLGRGAVIGAGSVVVGDVAEGAVVAGNPARPLPSAQ
jgi:serine O-acetyltransferase